MLIDDIGNDGWTVSVYDDRMREITQSMAASTTAVDCLGSAIRNLPWSIPIAQSLADQSYLSGTRPDAIITDECGATEDQSNEQISEINDEDLLAILNGTWGK